MKYILSGRYLRHDRLYKVSIAVWASILFLTGTYFRNRPRDILPEADWLVIAQLLTCCLGGFFGILLIRKHTNWGLGSKTLLVYFLAASLSIIGSPYPFTAIGYLVLLIGGGLLTIFLVQNAQTVKSLKQIENVWLIVVTAMLLKDTIISLVFFPTEARQYGGVFRVGMGVTHGVHLSILSAIAFWVSFRKEELKHPLLWWLLRLFFLMIIALSRTRMAMACVVIGGISRYWFKHGFQLRKGFCMRIVIPCFSLSALVFGILLLVFDVPEVVAIFDFLNRGQDSREIMSITGRTDVWTYAIKRVFDDPVSIFFGHGYHLSRYVLNEGHGKPPFSLAYVAHCHNTFLEFLFSMGFGGGITFVLMFICGIRWLTKYSEMCRDFSSDFALRAVSVVSMVLFSSITESTLATKISPIMIIYFFYLVALDRRQHLIR